MSKDKFDSMLKIGNRESLRRASIGAGLHLDSSQAHRLMDRLMTIDDSLSPYRLGIIHTYTSDLLDPWLRLCFALQGLACDVYHAPYGVTMLEAQRNSGLHNHSPDMTLLMLQRGDLHPALSQPLSILSAGDLVAVRNEAVDNLYSLVKQFRQVVGGQILLTILPSIFPPELGWYDVQSGRSETVWWAQAKSDLSLRLRDTLPGSFFVDLDELVLRCGRSNLFDSRFWYSARFPFSTEGATIFADAISSLAAAQKHVKAKVIVLDADNTMWGGVVGEDGLSGIALGPEYPGNAFVDFQKRILGFQQRGLLLALCSKNNQEDVQQVFDGHPHQVLKSDHFAAQRVNWLPKSENIRSIAEELNLGLDSFIFVDDSAHECAEVKHSLNGVEVVQIPERIVDIPSCLDKLPRLETLSLTEEDLEKTKMYAQERMRRDAKHSFSQEHIGIDDYLESLGMRMAVGLNDASHVKRMAQLTQKTNQYNLTTRRYTESDIHKFIQDDNWAVFHFSLSDSFGDSGLVGLAIVHFTKKRCALLDTFLMSCRVIGRKAELVFLKTIIEYLSTQKVEHFYAEYLPTVKNQPAQSFLPDSGFQMSTSGRLCLDLEAQFPGTKDKLPITVTKDF